MNKSQFSHFAKSMLATLVNCAPHKQVDISKKQEGKAEPVPLEVPDEQRDTLATPIGKIVKKLRERPKESKKAKVNSSKASLPPKAQGDKSKSKASTAAPSPADSHSDDSDNPIAEVVQYTQSQPVKERPYKYKRVPENDWLTKCFEKLGNEKQVRNANLKISTSSGIFETEADAASYCNQILLELAEGELFTDPFFGPKQLFEEHNGKPPPEFSLGPGGTIVWLRPEGIGKREGHKYEFLKPDIKHRPISLGAFQDYWLTNPLGVLANGALSLFALVDPCCGIFPETCWCPKLRNIGCYVVRLCRPEGGEACYVVIDDRFPCKIGGAGGAMPLFCLCQSGEFWVSLVQKAVAKLYGGYDKLRRMNHVFEDGFQDLLGLWR